MHNSKLIFLLKSLSAAELRKFRKFVASPYFNQNKELIYFYDYLRSVAPSFSSKKLVKKVVYAQLFPNQKYDDKHLKYLMSFLLKLAEQFIGQQVYEQNQTLRQLHILEACIDRKLEKNYHLIYKKVKTDLDRNKLRDIQFYHEQYLLAEIANRHFETKGLRQFSEELQKTADYFDLYFLSKKLKYICEMLSLQRFLSADYSQNMTEEISRYLQENKHGDVPVIALYHQVFLTLTQDSNEAHFKKLKLLIAEYAPMFAQTELNTMD